MDHQSLSSILQTWTTWRRSQSASADQDSLACATFLPRTDQAGKVGLCPVRCCMAIKTIPEIIM